MLLYTITGEMKRLSGQQEPGFRNTFVVPETWSGRCGIIGRCLDDNTTALQNAQIADDAKFQFSRFFIKTIIIIVIGT